MSTTTSFIQSPESFRVVTPDLFQILEELFLVKFTGTVPEGGHLLGRLRSAGESQATDPDLPTMELPSPNTRSDPLPLAEMKIEFSNAAEVPFPFRGRSVFGKVPQHFGALKMRAGEIALASVTGRVVWALSSAEQGGYSRSSLELPTIPNDGNFRDVLNGERFLELLPLVHWLRKISGQAEYQGLPVRAQFMFDDPNLHWPTYGHVNYREIISRAGKANYHVSFATVPLDNWFIHRPTAALFRQNSQRISLLVHGNNHVHQELAQNYTPAERSFLLRQSLQRIESLEAVAQLSVARVMAAPHGACSEEMLAELPRCGFDGATISHGSLRAHNKARAWVKSLGYRPSEIIQGCAVLPRWRLAAAAKNTILLAAYLQQPIILVGHHGDLKDGLELLDDLAGIINSLGPVAWLDMAEMARINYRWRMDGEVMKLRPLGSRVTVRPPTGASQLVVDSGDQSSWRTWRISPVGSPSRLIEVGKNVEISNGADQTIMLEVPAEPSVRLDKISSQPAMRPLVRRLATEARDRLVSFWR